MKKITLLVCLIFLSACAAQGKPAEITATAKAVPFLTYSRSGGFAGVNESWKIYSDGRIVSEKGEEKQANPEAARELLEQLQKADLSRLGKNTPSPEVCADCYTIEIVLSDGGKEIRLTVVPESQKADPTAIKVVELVQDFINSGH